ncbi:hypothetical protein SUGI_0017820 [Cryptomeria japonica]|nr:uncharacterized protein LOC131063049 isoform X2 [Cryptomeria japonica]XP_057852808.1 uncharacterized protein LOC131063049 isoform X2 [Cryptomeria japonica]XP_057852809.1 uncharacterized protein LOC131063049 isoform X2 [Cryptomeria japonica]GLJ05413.1 hypothetical protein SUGI_0017820 [Cryptomeria japonica]
MDMTPFKLDIDELVAEFTEIEATNLAQMKIIWRNRKFSFIHEARPTDKDSAFFMQTLYDRAISHMVSGGSLSKRLAGLYTLYCLYETQLFEQPFKIYLSLQDLEKLNVLVIDAKQNGVGVAIATVKMMLTKNMFLFGFVEVDEEFVFKTVNAMAKQQHAHLQVASKKLLSNLPIQNHVHMNLGMDLRLDELKKLASEYSQAKESVIQETSAMQGVDELLDVAKENGAKVGDDLERIAEIWNQQRQSFYVENRLDETHTNKGADDFVQELDELLSED